MCDSTLFHIRRKPNISLEKFSNLCYNIIRRTLLEMSLANTGLVWVIGLSLIPINWCFFR